MIEFMKISKYFGLILSLLIFSCKNNSEQGLIIFTEVKSDIQNLNFNTGENWRYSPESQIVLLKADKSENILSKNFYSACSPQISYDGRLMLFAAQEKKGDVWQIYEMDLDKNETRLVISLKENCIDPAYLPGNKLLFSKEIASDAVGIVHSLYACNSDGTGLQQITFSPGGSFATKVINEGRVLTISKTLYPKEKSSILAVMRPDGTKREMFYSADSGLLISRPCETPDRKLFFIESGIGGLQKSDVISINQNRPLHTRQNITSQIQGSFKSVSVFSSGKLLITHKPTDDKKFGIYELDINTGSVSFIYENPDYNIIDAVLIEKANIIPKKLPSEVDLGVKTGLLMCQNINFNDRLTSDIKAEKIEILGIDTTYGIVNIEEDGSFYLKVAADMPFKIQNLGENGQPVNEPSEWMWLRPNERRGCRGCHEDKELAPENRAALAIKKAPVSIPVHMTGIKEKEIELE